MGSGLLNRSLFVCNRFAEAVAGVAVKSALTTKRDDDERE